MIKYFHRNLAVFGIHDLQKISRFSKNHESLRHFIETVKATSMIQSALLPSVKVARNSKTAKTVKTRVKRCETLTHPVRQIRQKSLGFFFRYFCALRENTES